MKYTHVENKIVKGFENLGPVIVITIAGCSGSVCDDTRCAACPSSSDNGQHLNYQRLIGFLSEDDCRSKAVFFDGGEWDEGALIQHSNTIIMSGYSVGLVARSPVENLSEELKEVFHYISSKGVCLL